MRLLLLHCDYIEYEARKKTSISEEIDEGRMKGRMEETLVVFVAVERGDEENEEGVARKAVEEIFEVLSKLDTSNVMLYPYAHLSSSLASPSSALTTLKIMEKLLSEREINVKRAPFGWYKAFRLSCKGHPLSELSKTIGVDVSKALRAEERLKSYFYVLTPEGELVEHDKFDFSGRDNLKKFLSYEIEKKRAVDRIPPHVELMKRLELVDYEQGSDIGNLRYYPKGRLIKSLLEQRVIEKMVEYGAMEVETPIMYDMAHPTIKRYLDRFPARQYVIQTEKRRMFLRFAACFGQFLMSHDMTVPYKSLPLKIAELTRYSFRLEQRGEVVGLRRLRAFTMPDMHTLCRDIEQAKDEFMKQYILCMEMLSEIGIDSYEVAIRITKSFYDSNKELVKSLARKIGKPVVVEMWEERPFYFVLKFEFNFVDALDKASALSTVQIDVENAERYGITYVDENGAEKKPVILHCSPSGAIERCMYALLEGAYLSAEEGKLPMLPTWLSPTQLRIIPVSQEYVSDAIEIASFMGNVRVDVDDRDETVGKKIRDAGMEWIPYVAVIGEEEKKSGKLSVTIRSKSTLKNPHIVKISPKELRDVIVSECEGLPWKPLPLNRRLSLRPKFR